MLVSKYEWGASEGVAELQAVLGITIDGVYGPATRATQMKALKYVGVTDYQTPLAPWEQPDSIATAPTVTTTAAATTITPTTTSPAATTTTRAVRTTIAPAAPIFPTDTCFFEGVPLQGNVYFTDSSYFADLDVYFTDSSYFADLNVYFTDSSYFATSCGNWHVTDSSYFADFSVYVTDSSYFADLDVYVTDSSYFAGR